MHIQCTLVTVNKVKKWYSTNNKKLCCRTQAKPYDDACPSVVSFNSTIAWALSFIISYSSFRFTKAYKFKFCSVFFDIPINWCKWCRTFAVINNVHWCVATVVNVYCDKLYCVVETVYCLLKLFTTLNAQRSSSYWSQSQILVKNHDFCPS